ncbi:hypothetical protein E4U55_005829, partial [Claviceps digitariae]
MDMAGTNKEPSRAFQKSQDVGTVNCTISEETTTRTRTIRHKAFRRWNATEDDILEAKKLAASMSLEHVRAIMQKVQLVHEGDSNFPHDTMQNIKDFLAHNDMMDDPNRHKERIQEMKLEAALLTNNSPYAEVRAVTDNHDDLSLPVSTIRAWTIGVFFSCFLALFNQLFSLRSPPIRLNTNIIQLLVYPVGKAWAEWMPRVHMRIPFTKHIINLNPGRFNKKEHMLIVLMANASKGLPFTQYIIWTQLLPPYVQRQYAHNFSYILLNSFASSFLGYALAGLTKEILVYPSYCVWPQTLATIALSTALHSDKNQPVKGPSGHVWSSSRCAFFTKIMILMYSYSWFPEVLCRTLKYFSWMTWIAPDNVHLNVVAGVKNGLGLLNPLPTFDWNIVSSSNTDPLMIPFFSTLNAAGGMFMTGLAILGVWYTNVWNTAYLPVNSSDIFNHFGKIYNMSFVLDMHGNFDPNKYSSYSAPYLSAANLVFYGCYFALYSAVVAHVMLYYRQELKTGLLKVVRRLSGRRRRVKSPARPENGNVRTANAEDVDVHRRLMAAYPQVSAWLYFAILTTSIVCGVVASVLWPTPMSYAVVIYGIWLCVVLMIPIGIFAAMTGLEMTLDVLAGLIGGVLVKGNASAMNIFRLYSFITCTHALSIAKDLKMAHYVK